VAEGGIFNRFESREAGMLALNGLGLWDAVLCIIEVRLIIQVSTKCSDTVIQSQHNAILTHMAGVLVHDTLLRDQH
jgi:hypothetical protein